MGLETTFGRETAAIDRTLRYACVSLCGGYAAVVMSEYGVVDVCFAENHVDLARELRTRFSESALLPDGGLRRPWVDAVVQRFRCRTPGDRPEFPVDLYGARLACGA